MPWDLVLGSPIFLKRSSSKDRVHNESQDIHVASVWIIKNHLLPIAQWVALLVSEKSRFPICLFWIMNSPWTLVALSHGSLLLLTYFLGHTLFKPLVLLGSLFCLYRMLSLVWNDPFQKNIFMLISFSLFPCLSRLQIHRMIVFY